MPDGVDGVESAADEGQPTAWTRRSYKPVGTVRGVTTPSEVVTVAPEQVVELELQDGTLLLVPGHEATRYLTPAAGGEARDIGDAAGQPWMVGTALQLAGLGVPERPSRDGLGGWLLKGLRVFTQGSAATTALVAAGLAQDAQLGQRQGLYRLATAAWGLAPVDQMPSSPEVALLFLHGTGSSCEGSFRGLWGPAEGHETEVDFRDRLRQAYGDRVYGFEHRSLTVSPVANALALVQALPQGARLHLVSHSRGGMVGELLARANRTDADPITAADLQRFSAQAARSGRTAHEPDLAALRQLSAALKDKRLQIERFVRVAAPVRGTTLASGRLDRWANVVLNLPRLGLAAVPLLQPLDPAYDALKSFLLAVVQERTDARVLPGLEAMMPDSPLVALLNAPEVKVSSPVHVIAGDYDGAGLLGWLGDSLSEAFYGGHTDLVVNTASMTGGGARAGGLWVKPVTGPAVHHLSYFRRRESADALWSALQGSNQAYTALAAPSDSLIARGGTAVKPRADAPIVLVLPGIMGTQLAHGSPIWLDPWAMINGRMDELKVDAPDVQTSGWVDDYYDAFARRLQLTHEVRPFVYDWRLSIAKAATDFGLQLDLALSDAEKRRQPLRIAAHSMGGLVARLALSLGPRWDRLQKLPGSRLVQFGTPNGGSHAMAVVLTGRDSFVQMIERWFDWRHDMHEFLDIVNQYPGVLELLPWPVVDPQTLDRQDYHDVAFWQALAHGDQENERGPAAPGTGPMTPAEGRGAGWSAPRAQDLDRARQVVRQIMAAPLPSSHTCYVAGSAPTPVALQARNGQIEVAWSDEGDGRVPWRTGIPPGAKTYYVDAAHGDLMRAEACFDEYIQLLQTGECRLASQPVARRGIAGQQGPVPAGTDLAVLYPSAGDVLAAAMGARGGLPRRRGAGPADQIAKLEVYHGSLAAAYTPVLIGAYAYDSLRGSAAFLDKHLDGLLGQAQMLGRYPGFVGEAALFERTGAAQRAAGAVVVGLGAVGDLQPGELTRALTQGLNEFARTRAAGLASPPPTPVPLEISSLLVGTGWAGLPASAGVRCLFEAVRRCNRACAAAGLPVRIAKLMLFDDEESRAIAAAQAALDLGDDARYVGWLSYDGRICKAQGGYTGRGLDAGTPNGWQRVYITEHDGAGLRFNVVSNRAGSRLDDAPDQRSAVRTMVADATRSTADQPALSRALYELLLPNGLKETLSDQGGVVLSVDAVAAAYPWELMRDETTEADQRPLVTRVGLVRQLASPRGRLRVLTVTENRALVIGDTRTDYAELPGAAAEAQTVAAKLAGPSAGGSDAFQVVHLQRPDASTVYQKLFDERYRVLHIAAHGSAQADGKTGVVVGNDEQGQPLLLGAAQIAQLRRVPELVFLNCCHLGNTEGDARQRWGELAASLSTQLIEMGCKVVVAAGWAVDDQAAAVFSATFYTCMLGGVPFGEAVRQAREQTHAGHPASNTWGAYQAYGDESYRLVRGSASAASGRRRYLHVGQVLFDLEVLSARIGPMSEGDRQSHIQRLNDIGASAGARFWATAEVQERLAAAWALLGEEEQAIAAYRAALERAGAMSLPALEQLANLEIRSGARMARGADPARSRTGMARMDTGYERLQDLLKLSPTPERWSLIASYWKRLTTVADAAGGGEAQRSGWLGEMCRHYLQASELSLALDGDRDYYGTLNLLDGAIVLAARGFRGVEQRLDREFAGLMASAQANATRRLADERSYFHAHVQVDALRIDALRAQLQHPGQGLAEPGVREQIVQRHRQVSALLGDANSHDSSTTQLDWLVLVLPDTGRGAQMAAAVAALKRQLQEG